jgi:uncharacterized protein YcnI
MARPSFRAARAALRAAWPLAAALALPALPAAAHVTLETQQAPANSYYKAVFRVGHGCAPGVPTTRVTVRLPEGVTAARPMPKPGWRLALTPREEQPANAAHGAAPELAEVSWEGGPLEDAHYDEFVIRLRLPDRPGEMLWLPVVQDCPGGAQSAWVEVPQPGHRVTDYRRPAAALRLLPRN